MIGPPASGAPPPSRSDPRIPSERRESTLPSAGGALDEDPEQPPPMPAAAHHPRVIPPRESRRILLAAQGLSKPPANRSGPASVQRLIERLGFVQVDSINVLERAHHLILQTRLESYRHETLTRLLEKDRSLFEHWTHDASLIPTRWFEHWKPRFARYADRVDRSDWWQERLGGDPAPLLERIHQRVRTAGPLRGRDLEDERSEDGGGGWWNWHPGKAALEHLWRSGRLSIAGRNRFEKIYDLTERVHPEPYDRPKPSASAHLDWACRTALERLGVATANEVAAFWNSISTADARAWCDAAVGRGEIEPVILKDLDDRSRAAYATDESRRWAKVVPWDEDIRTLCPFDPVIRDRKRIQRRFGFDYRFEAFVPEARRRYGYYTLPLLRGDRFLGRIDPKFDRRKDVLMVRGPWWEPGCDTRLHRNMLETATNRLAAQIGAASWQFVD